MFGLSVTVFKPIWTWGEQEVKATIRICVSLRKGLKLSYLS
jgi:hypothetical protein